MKLLANLAFVLWAVFVSAVAGVVGIFVFIQMPCTWFGQMHGNGCGYEWLGNGLIAGAVTAAIVFLAYTTWYFRRRFARI